MASLTIQLTGICASGNHLTFALSGAKDLVVNGELSEMLDPVTDDEAQAFVKIIAKLVRIGRTNAQARTALQAGVTVTL